MFRKGEITLITIIIAILTSVGTMYMDGEFDDSNASSNIVCSENQELNVTMTNYVQ